jgi:DNA-binding response OmpR family regulator
VNIHGLGFPSKYCALSSQQKGEGTIMAASYGAIISSISQEPNVNVSDIQWDTQHHNIMVRRAAVGLTATEYRLLFPLRHGTAVTYADLAWMAYQYDLDEKVRTMMDKHIDRIRGKLRGTGIYIYCVLGYGYLLLPEPPFDE